jgi:hypothetical protein
MRKNLKKQIEEVWAKKTEAEKEEFRRAVNNKNAGRGEYIEGIVGELKRRAFIKKEEKIIKKLEEKLRKLNKELKEDGKENKRQRKTRKN